MHAAPSCLLPAPCNLSTRTCMAPADRSSSTAANSATVAGGPSNTCATARLQRVAKGSGAHPWRSGPGRRSCMLCFPKPSSLRILTSNLTCSLMMPSTTSCLGACGAGAGAGRAWEGARRQQQASSSTTSQARLQRQHTADRNHSRGQGRIARSTAPGARYPQRPPAGAASAGHTRRGRGGWPGGAGAARPPRATPPRPPPT